MKNIVVNTKNQFIGNTLISFLKDHFENDVILLNNLTTKDLNSDSLYIIIDSNYLDMNILQELISKNYKAIVLTSLENKSKIKDITNSFLTFPVFLPNLLNKINQINLASINKINILRKFDFTFELDYSKATLTSNTLNTFVKFTLTEGNIFQKLFIDYPNEVSTKDLYNASNCLSYDSNTLETHISNIKKKLVSKKLNISIIKEKDKYKLLIY